MGPRFSRGWGGARGEHFAHSSWLSSHGPGEGALSCSLVDGAQGGHTPEFLTVAEGLGAAGCTARQTRRSESFVHQSPALG